MQGKVRVCGLRTKNIRYDLNCAGFKKDAGVKFGDSVCHAVLLGGLRVHDQRDTIVKAFVDAVHAAVREKNIQLSGKVSAHGWN